MDVTKNPLSDPTSIFEYGRREQNKLAQVSTKVLNSVSSNKLHNVDEIIRELIVILNNTNTKKRSFKFLGRRESEANQEEEVMKQVSKLELTFLNAKVNMLEMEKILNNALPAYKELQRKIVEAKDYQSHFTDDQDLLSEKINALELSSAVSMQIFTQMQAIIISDKTLIAKIEFIIKTTIPSWRASIISSIQDKRGSDSRTNDSVVNELKSLLDDCQKNKEEHNKIKELSLFNAGM